MKLKLLCVSMLVLSFSGLSFAEDAAVSGRYGAAAITLDAPVSVGHAIAHFDALQDREILLEGKAAKVCQQQGCWMVLASEQGEVRVIFKDHAFFVPPGLVGRQVWAQGRLYAETLDVAQARHFAQDGGASKEELEKIDQPVREYHFVATAVAERP